MRLRTKIGLSFLAAGLLPALTCAFIGYRGATNTIANDIGKRFQQSSVDVLDKVDRCLFERYGDVQAFGFNAAFQDQERWYTPEDPILTRWLNSYMTTYSIYGVMLLVDTEGKVIAVNTVDGFGKPLDTAAVWSQNFATPRARRSRCGRTTCAGIRSRRSSTRDTRAS
ncbi:MAG: hypothetical protein SGJ11_04010 [Phycisphaerae bacterium]|nr:hypothetical protein [Phycisphaerae bacterium]